MSNHNDKSHKIAAQLGPLVFLLVILFFIFSDVSLPTGGLRIYHMKGLLLGTLVLVGLIGLIGGASKSN